MIVPQIKAGVRIAEASVQLQVTGLAVKKEKGTWGEVRRSFFLTFPFIEQPLHPSRASSLSHELLITLDKLLSVRGRVNSMLGSFNSV